MANSKHLSEIIDRHNRITTVQVVFLDIEKYSRRRTQAQIAVIDAFTQALSAALKHIAKHYVDYAQDNQVNFANDVILLPTGDGAAIGFSFEGLHDIHLVFALQVLDLAWTVRTKEPCDKFDSAGWCNCHPYFNARVGISEGKTIIYKDINGYFNLAGAPVNLAARIMGKVDRNQIGFSTAAYEQIVDMVDDPNLSDRFLRYPDVTVKHGENTDIYQYLDTSIPGLNSGMIELLNLDAEINSAMARLSGVGFPMPNFGMMTLEDRTEMGRGMLNVVQQMETLMEVVTGAKKTPPTIEAQAREPKEE